MLQTSVQSNFEISPFRDLVEYQTMKVN